MKKLFTFFAVLICASAFFIPFDALSENMKNRANYQYGDAMGDAPDDVWSYFDHYFYGKDGKIIRAAQLYRPPVGGDITVNKKTIYTYDDQGRLTNYILYQAKSTSFGDVDKEYVFEPKNRYNYEYNDQGQLICSWSQKWSKTKSDWDVTYKTNYTEYTYNADGTKDEERLWMNYYTANPTIYKPVVTKYIYGNQGSNPVKTQTSQENNSGSNWYVTEFTYDASGKRVHSITTYNKEGYSKYNQVKEEKEWEYEGDFLTAVVNVTKNTRVHYKMDGNDPNNYFEYNEKYNEAEKEWKKSSPIFHQYYKQDYSGMENIVPELSVTSSEENSRNNVVKFKLPQVLSEAYTVKVYRDEEEIGSFTKDELAAIYDGSQYYTFTDKGLTAGEHEYFAQVILGNADGKLSDYMEGYISDIFTIETVIQYPKVADFKVKGYDEIKHFVAEYTDPDTQEVTPAHYEKSYKLVLEWTPLTDEQVEGFGFERYEIFYKSYGSDVSLETYTDIKTGSAKVDWMKADDGEMEVWLSVKYGQDFVPTEHYTVKLADLVNLTEANPMPVYGAIYQGGYTPAFVKADLSKPTEKPEVIYSLWDDNQADLQSIYGGVSAGDYYYALYVDENYETCFGAFDMTNKAYTRIGEPYTGVEADFSDLLYDAESEKLYAVLPAENNSSLYAIDPENGTSTNTGITLPAYTLYLAATDEPGKAYAMAAETGKFQLYSVDLVAGSYTKIDGVTVDGNQSGKWCDLFYSNKTLYFNLDKKLFSIEVDKKVVEAKNDLSSALSGIVLAQSSKLPDIVKPMGEYAHMVASERSAAGSINYYYSPWNVLERVSEFDAENNMTKYTKNVIDEANRITSAEVYEPSVDEYGVKTMQKTASTTYTYNEDGMLSEKSNSDGTWERFTYEGGYIATITSGQGETTDMTATYMYDEYQPEGKPAAIMYASETNPDNNYVAMFGYDESGNKVVEYHTKDLTSGVYTSFETWEYFPKTNVVSAHNICSPTEFVEGMPVVLSSTKYQMLEDINHLMSQEFDASGNPIEGTAKDLRYSDLTDTAESAFVQIEAMEVENSANDVNVSFTIPMLAYTGSAFSLDFFRDGVQVGQLQMSDISTMDPENYVFADKQVPNGEHEYFVRTNKIGEDESFTALQISPIADVTLNKELPVVTDIAYVKYETKYVDAEGQITEDANKGTETYFVTIGWKNPEIPADYGFTGNHIFLMNGTTPTTAGVVTDLQTAESSINVGAATAFDVMIQSRYALGVANSATQSINFSEFTGVDGVYDNGFNLTIADKIAIANTDAIISVFDMNGTRVASTYGERLDLSDFNGAYIVTAEAEGTVRIKKVIL